MICGPDLEEDTWWWTLRAIHCSVHMTWAGEVPTDRSRTSLLTPDEAVLKPITRVGQRSTTFSSLKQWNKMTHLALCLWVQYAFKGASWRVSRVEQNLILAFFGLAWKKSELILPKEQFQTKHGKSFGVASGLETIRVNARWQFLSNFYPYVALMWVNLKKYTQIKVKATLDIKFAVAYFGKFIYDPV